MSGSLPSLTRAPSGATSSAAQARSDCRFEKLEPRILLSADLLGGAIAGDLGNTHGSDLDFNSDYKLDKPKDLGELVAPLVASLGRDHSLVSQATLPGALDLAELDSYFERGPDFDLRGAAADAFGENTAEHFAEGYAALLAEAANDDLRQEIIFIDAATPDYEQLVEGIASDTSQTRFLVFILDGERDGIEQISDVLADYQGVDAIHLVSHGSEGQVNLGNGSLNTNNVNAYANALTSWQNALAGEADVLIYGCDLAGNAAGQDLLLTLASLTGADIAASDDLTGTAALGGDWELEYRLGQIETNIAFTQQLQQSWHNTLATFVVDTTADTIDISLGDGSALDAGGTTSLRSAVMEANALPGDDTIILGPGTYSLSGVSGENSAVQGDLDILSNIDIVGSDAATTIIDGAGVDRVFHVQGSGINLSLSNLTVQGGVVSGGGINGQGGGIFVQPGTQITLDRVIVSGNQASVDGGGIYNDGTAILSDVVISGNNTTGGGASEGGGFFNKGAATFDSVTVSGNTAGKGGGIVNDFTSTSIDLENVTISGNTATGGEGGGLLNEFAPTLKNVTVSNNTAQTQGGGIYSSWSFDISNTIIANNTSVGGTGHDVFGNFTSDGSNIVEDSAGSADFAGDTTGVDPGLAALDYNGGFTQTHALQDGSIAIDSGTNVAAPATDQRGYARADGLTDIGAYEALTFGLIWVDQAAGKIQTADYDGSNVSDLLTGLTSPQSVAVDTVNGKVYWSDDVLNNIQRANLDGSGVETIISSVPGTIAIELNVPAGKIYWVEGSGGELLRANLDGTSIESLVGSPNVPTGIAIDAANDKVYWADVGNDRIKQTSLTGAGTSNLIGSGLGASADIALDLNAGQLYWSDSVSGEIRRVDLDGTNLTTVISGLGDPYGLAIDSAAGKIYWTDDTTDQVHRANLDGSGAEILASGIVTPRDIDVVQGGVATTGLAAYEPFNYGAGSLEGANGGSGWATGWTTNEGTSALVNASGLTSPTGTLPVQGGHAELNTSALYSQSRDLNNALGADGSTVWVSFLLQADVAFGEGISLELGESTGDRVSLGTTNDDFIITKDRSTAGAAWINDFVTDGQTYLLTVKLEFFAGNDTVTLYVDPTPGLASPDSALTAQLTSADLGTFDQVALLGGFSGNTSSIDEIRIGASFSDVAPAPPVVLDQFNTIAYNGSDGALPWANDWQEFGDGTGPSGGSIQVTNYLGSNALQIRSNGDGAWREADISSGTAATLSFDYARLGMDAGDAIVVYVQKDGGTGGTSLSGAPGTWDELLRFDGPAADDTAYQAASIDISSYIATDTRVLFIAESMVQGGDFFYVDNVQIELTGTGNTVPSGSGSLTTTSLDDNAGATNLFGGLTVSDPDGETDLVLRITLSDPTAGTISGGGFVDQGGGIYDVSGLTEAQANTALDNVQFTPTDNTGSSGTFNVDISADVDDGDSGFQSVLSATTMTITRVNDDPTLDNAISDQSATEDSSFNFTFAANTFGDADIGDSLTYSAQLAGGGSLPTWLSFDDATRTFSGTPANGDVGTVSVAVIADDGNGGTPATDTFDIVVGGVNNAPTVTGPWVAFINEIHYDNIGVDTGEAVEIAGVAGVDLAGWQLVMYTGVDGTVYETVNLSGVISNQADNFGTLAFFTVNPIQNATSGNPDGMALVDPTGAVVQFLSYEGTFVATEGPANGMLSTDIGVAEDNGSTLATESLQLTGPGPGFSWMAPSLNTFGAINSGQDFAALAAVTHQSIAEDTSLVFSAGNGNAITVDDPDAGQSPAADPVSVKLDVSNGSLTLGDTTGLGSVVGNGSGSVIFTGTLAEMNAALEGLTYQPDLAYNGTDTLTILVDDLGNWGAGGNLLANGVVHIVIDPENDAPTLSGGPYNLGSGDEDNPVAGTQVSTILAGLTAADADGDTLGIAVTATSGDGTWRYSTDSTDGVDGTWTDFGAVLPTSALILSDSTWARFIPDDDGSTPDITFRAWDGSADSASTTGSRVNVDPGPGGGTSAYSSGSAQATLNIAAVNDLPGGSGSLSTTSLDDNAGASNLFGGLTVSDADTGENDLVLRITLSDATAGTISGGGFTDQGGGVYTATGLTEAQANTALDNVQFSPTDNSGSSGTFTTDISVDVDDGDSGYQSVLSATTVTITRINDDPTLIQAIPDQNATEDTAFSFAFAPGTFDDPDTGDTLTYTSDASGWLSFNAATRTFSGTPLNADVGTTTVTVTADDGNGGTAASDTFDIVVANSNDDPTLDNAIADQVATEDSSFTFTFAANTFGDADGDTLTYTSDASGWLSFNAATRTFSGTPLNADVGTTTVTVTADDGNGGTAASDTFDIVVANTNDDPTLDNAITDQGAVVSSPFTFTFAANTFGDVDVGDTLTYSAQLAGGGALPGWLSFDGATRTFSGTPLAGDVGTVSIDVIADDGNGGAPAMDTFDIDVVLVNNDPTLDNPIGDQSATEDSPFSFTFAANTFGDADANPLTYTAQLAGGGALPTWLSFDSATRTFSGTPLNGDVGSIAVAVTADDGFGGTPATDTFDIVVVNTDDDPTLDNPIADQSGTANAPFTFTFAVNTFSDADAGDSLTYSAQLAGGGALPAWLGFNGTTRTFVGLPLNTDVGTVSIDVIADDGNGGPTALDTFDIVIGFGNSDPTLDNAIPDQVATQDSPFSFTFAANTFGDADGDTLTYSSDASGWLSFNAATRTFSGTPLDADVGTTTITVTADDGNGGVATDTFAILVGDSNEDPTVDNAIPDQVATQDSPFSFTFAANTFGDADGDTLTYSSDASGWLSFDAATRTFSGTPLDADVGTTTITVTADDGNGGVATDTFAIVVGDSNEAPTVNNAIPDQVATEDSPFSFTFAANTFGDVDGDTLTYSSDASGWLSFNAATRTFSGTPLDADVGTTTVTVTADDGNGGVATETFAIAVSNQNDAPSGTVTIAGVLAEGGLLTATVSLTDDDGLGNFSYQWQRDGVDIGGATGGNYTLSEADSGADITVLVSYTDARGSVENVTSNSLVYTILPADDGPAKPGTDSSPTEQVDGDKPAPVSGQPETDADPQPDSNDIVDPSGTAIGAPAVTLLDEAADDSSRQLTREIDQNDTENDLSRELDDPPSEQPKAVTSLITLQTEFTPYNDPLVLINFKGFVDGVDELREEVEGSRTGANKVIGSTFAVSAGLSAGYIAWLARSGVILSSVLSALPVWRFIDPLPVLSGSRDGSEDEESLQSLIDDAERETDGNTDGATRHNPGKSGLTNEQVDNPDGRE